MIKKRPRPFNNPTGRLAKWRKNRPSTDGNRNIQYDMVVIRVRSLPEEITVTTTLPSENLARAMTIEVRLSDRSSHARRSTTRRCRSAG
jgi:hypothetical protein